MKIKSFATYGVGMDIIYEDILSTGAIRVNTLFDVMDTKDIGILRELEARIRGYIRGERAQAKFDFSLKDDVEDDYEE